MPETKYTAFANQGFDLLSRIHEFAEIAVRPAIVGLAQDSSRGNRQRDAVLAGVFLRILGWMKSLEKLNRTADFQAVGTGTRCLFELYLDVRWLEKFPEPEWITRYSTYSNVDRYMSAKKIIEHKAKHPGSTIDPRSSQDFLNKVNSKEPMDQVVRRVWGQKTDGSPNWPRLHWTGIGNLSDRAEAVGIDALDAYRELYPVLSWLVHSGPTSYFGRDFSHFEGQIALEPV